MGRMSHTRDGKSEGECCKMGGGVKRTAGEKTVKGLVSTLTSKKSGYSQSKDGNGGK